MSRPLAALTIDEILAAARSRLTRLSPGQAQQAIGELGEVFESGGGLVASLRVFGACA